MYNNINLIQGSIEHKKKPKRKRGFWYKLTRFLLFILIAYFVISFFLSSKVIFSQTTFSRAITKLPVVSQIRSLLGAEDVLVARDEDRVNFLLMGIGGSGHEGALLTDTMMLGSVKLSTNQAALVSIPRDLLVKIPDNGYQRVNHASAYGDINDYEGGGSALAAKTIENTFDLPVDYWLRIDFSGFRTMIDDLGGIDIYVERSFTDNKYPAENFEVQTISFEQGMEHMDGERALRFARSRHGDNGEGSDFARSKRQQKILFAIKDKILSWKTLANPNRVYKIYDSLSNHIQTNIGAGQIPEFIGLLRDIDFESIEHHILDDSPSGLLKPIVTEDGAQVLVPKAGDLSELRDFVSHIFVVKEIMDERVTIIMANGTTEEGLATYLGSNLTAWGFTIQRLTNSPQQDFEKTVIYDLNQGEQQEALKILKRRMDANATEKVPEFLEPVLYKVNELGEEERIEVDFLIVVGLDQQRAISALQEWREQQTRLMAEAEEEQENTPEEEETLEE